MNCLRTKYSDTTGILLLICSISSLSSILYVNEYAYIFPKQIYAHDTKRMDNKRHQKHQLYLKL